MERFFGRLFLSCVFLVLLAVTAVVAKPASKDGKKLIYNCLIYRLLLFIRLSCSDSQDGLRLRKLCTNLLIYLISLDKQT